MGTRKVRKYRYSQRTVLSEWACKYPCVQVYLSKVSAKDTEAYELAIFCEICNIEPDRLLALKTGYNDLRAEQLLDTFVADQSLPESLRFRCSGTVRGFFKRNYRALQPEAGKIEYLTKKERRFLTKAERRALFDACLNIRDRVLVSLLCCTAIAAGSVIALRWGHFEVDWRKRDVPHISLPSNVLKGQGRGKYRGVRQETFITPECKRLLLEYREYMTKHYGILWREDDNVFLLMQQGKHPMTYCALSQMAKAVSEASGVPFTTHDGRRVVETVLEDVGVSRNWVQKVKGRSVRGEDNPYSVPMLEALRAKYRLAVPALEFLAESEVVAVQSEVSRLNAEKENLAVENQTTKMLLKQMMADQQAIKADLESTKFLLDFMRSDPERWREFVAHIVARSQKKCSPELSSSG